MHKLADNSDFKIDFYATVAALPNKHRWAARLIMQGCKVPEVAKKIGVSKRYVYTILKNMECSFDLFTNGD